MTLVENLVESHHSAFLPVDRHGHRNTPLLRSASYVLEQCVSRGGDVAPLCATPPAVEGARQHRRSLPPLLTKGTATNMGPPLPPRNTESSSCSPKTKVPREHSPPISEGIFRATPVLRRAEDECHDVSFCTSPSLVSSCSLGFSQVSTETERPTFIGDVQSGSALSSVALPICAISMVERLIRTTDIWYLPQIARSGAVHLLQGKEAGNFIVRRSSQPNTMAISVRLPPGKGPYIEHYLIELIPDGKMRLDRSENLFVGMPVLIAHYSQCCDELPVQLKLPAIIMEATTRQELISMALLGQEFWHSSVLRNSLSPSALYVPPPPSGKTQSLESLCFPGTPQTEQPIGTFGNNNTKTSSEIPTPLPRTVYSPKSPPVPPPRVKGKPTSPAMSENKCEQAPDAAYYSSSLAEKISDYEDVWQESSNAQVDPAESDPWSTAKSRRQPIQASQSSELLVPENTNKVHETRAWLLERYMQHRHSDPNVESLIDTLKLPQPLETVEENLGEIPAVQKDQKLWTLDPTWHWITQESSTSEEEDTMPKSSKSQPTVEDLIFTAAPELQVPSPSQDDTRHSNYDNVAADEDNEDNVTEFCEPWDSSQWQSLLCQVEQPKNTSPYKHIVTLRRRTESKSTTSRQTSSIDTLEDVMNELDDDDDENEEIPEFPRVEKAKRTESFFRQVRPVLESKRERTKAQSEHATVAGNRLRDYIYKLAADRRTTFSRSIENFIQCTIDGQMSSPAVVMRNIRQFMNGMKNYLLKHGEGQFDQLVQEERAKLRTDEFLNIDAIVESAMHRLVIKPLKSHIYRLFVNDYNKSGSLKLLSDNIRHALSKTPEELGVKSHLKPPEGTSLEAVKYFLRKLQQSYSPLKKLEHLLSAIAVIYNSVLEEGKSVNGCNQYTSLGADDFLPIFLYVLVQCRMISAEVEADYMWGLLHPSLLNGEGGYYLTTLGGAVHILKNLNQLTAPQLPAIAERETPRWSPSSSSSSGNSSVRSIGSPPREPIRYPAISDLQGFMQIMIPDETSGTIITKTFPVRPHMTTKNVCSMIAHKFNITNPQDYALYVVVNGMENILNEGDCPQTIKADYITRDICCRFAYKRCDSHIVWPVLRPMQ